MALGNSRNRTAIQGQRQRASLVLALALVNSESLMNKGVKEMMNRARFICLIMNVSDESSVPSAVLKS